MARWLYCLALYLGAPLVWLRLWLRSRKQAAYWQHLGERWGYYPQRGGNAPYIWVHAVSVGETRAAQPLIQALQAKYPAHRMLLTCMTPTGRATGQEVYGGVVTQAYLPYDYPGAVQRFLAHFQPQMGVLMETELWPNLLHATGQKDIPVILANARLSARSARGYARFSALVAPAFKALSATAAQTEEDAKRLAQLGASRPVVCGNIKFDVQPPEDKLALGHNWRESIAGRFIWLAASTREGEEPLVLDAFMGLNNPDVLLVLVPRHPQRFAEVAQLIEDRGIIYQKRSIDLPHPDTRVWLGDSMGEMAAYYAMADLAFIGGSLLPLGGQNLIEAAACGCPVLVGPHTFNFAQATTDALAAGAARQVSDSKALADEVSALSRDASALQAMAGAARAFASAHRGATARTLAVIDSAWCPAER